MVAKILKINPIRNIISNGVKKISKYDDVADALAAAISGSHSLISTKVV
jgi:Holliday junction resolvasome RuvABC endonuclease subunit